MVICMYHKKTKIIVVHGEKYKNITILCVCNYNYNNINIIMIIL
jgi:hypothetical protein